MLCLLASLAASPVSVLPLLSTGRVIVVDQSGGGDHVQIQAAINAAVDGDVLRILPGAAPCDGFVIDDKSLILYGDSLSQVDTLAALIRNVAVDRYVGFSNLRLLGGDSPGLSLRDNAGTVGVFGCDLESRDTDSTSGALAVNSAHVQFVDSHLIGGTAEGELLSYPPCTGKPGGAGCEIIDSHVTFYRCFVDGGNGADGNFYCFITYGGEGGNGIAAYGSSELLFSASEATGGNGGWGVPANDGQGGTGLDAGSTSQAYVLDSHLFGGQGSPDGSKWGGSVQFLPGAAPALRVIGRRPVQGLTRVQVTGNPGDEAFVLVSDASALENRISTLRGFLHVENPSSVFIGTVPPSGTLAADVELPPPPHVFPGWDWRLQAMTKDPLNVRTLTNPSLPWLRDFAWPR